MQWNQNYKLCLNKRNNLNEILRNLLRKDMNKKFLMHNKKFKGLKKCMMI